jgi:hypothetical protein
MVCSVCSGERRATSGDGEDDGDGDGGGEGSL